MIKLVGSYDFSFNEAASRLVKCHSRGVDFSNFSKTASSDEMRSKIAKLKVAPDQTYVHVLAVGDTEKTGANRNADGFSGHWNKTAYEHFLTGHLFKHHKNDDPAKSVGKVSIAHYNEPMGRIELVIGMDNKKCAEEVNKVNKGEDIAVSMGCVTDPNFPVLTIDGFKPISDVVVGDEVLSHKGVWRKVTELHRRVFTGKLCTLRFRGLPLPLELTEDHPLMAKVFEAEVGSRPYTGNKEFESCAFKWAHVSHLSKGDHVQYVPAMYSADRFCSISDVKLARLMGFYLAEGSFGYNNGKPNQVDLSCHLDDDLPRLVPTLVNELFPGTTCSVRTHTKSPLGLVVSIFSTQFAGFLEKYIGHLASKKHIPPEMFTSPTDVKLAFLGSWLSGDGFLDQKGVHWSSCNLGLVLQGRDLLLSVGIPASVYKNVHKAGTGFNYHDTTEYVLNVSSIDAAPLVPYAERKLSKLAEYISLRKKPGNSCVRCNSDGTFAYSISEVTTRDAIAVQTYNFEVETDESFLLAGLVSHNCKVAHDVCSICNNKAKTPESYCDHMKTAAGKILDDGRVVYVDNPDPKYFDISVVHRPADRCAFSFNKVAGVNEWVSSVDLARAVGLTDGGTPGYNLKIASAIRKLSAMEKQVEGMIDGDKSKELASVLPVETDDSAKVCNDISKKLCSGDLKNVIASLADHHVLLTEADFFKIALGKGYAEVAADVDKIAAYLPGVYTRMLNDPSTWDVAESMTDGNKDYLALSVSDGVKKLAGYCRIDMSTVSKSVVKSLLSNTKVSNIKKAEDNNTSSSRFKALADIYASYKLATILLTDADAIMTKSVVVSNYLKV